MSGSIRPVSALSGCTGLYRPCTGLYRLYKALSRPRRGHVAGVRGLYLL